MSVEVIFKFVAATVPTTMVLGGIFLLGKFIIYRIKWMIE